MIVVNHVVKQIRFQNDEPEPRFTRFRRGRIRVRDNSVLLIYNFNMAQITASSFILQDGILFKLRNNMPLTHDV